MRAAFVLLSLTACGVARSGGTSCELDQIDAIAPATALEPMADDAAVAVLERWLPSRSEDEGLRTLVDAELRTPRARHIGERAVQTIHELSAIRALIVERGMPDLFVGIPYWESYLQDDAVSRSCAAGPWQLMPETAVELGLQVEGCQIGGATWSPQVGDVASPASPYRGDSCRIATCQVDERTDLSRSTQGALELLSRMWEAPDVAASPDRAGLVVLAYNTGLGAVRNRVARVEDAWKDVVRCAADGGCTGFSAQAARYVPGVLASTAIVTCAAAEVPGTRFADERETSVCRALRDEGLVAAAEVPLPQG